MEQIHQDFFHLRFKRANQMLANSVDEESEDETRARQSAQELLLNNTRFRSKEALDQIQGINRRFDLIHY